MRAPQRVRVASPPQDTELPATVASLALSPSPSHSRPHPHLHPRHHAPPVTLSTSPRRPHRVALNLAVSPTPSPSSQVWAMHRSGLRRAASEAQEEEACQVAAAAAAREQPARRARSAAARRAASGQEINQAKVAVVLAQALASGVVDLQFAICAVELERSSLLRRDGGFLIACRLAMVAGRLAVARFVGIAVRHTPHTTGLLAGKAQRSLQHLLVDVGRWKGCSS